MKTPLVRLTPVVTLIALAFVALVCVAFAAHALAASSANPPAGPQTQLTLKKPDLTIQQVQPTVILPCPPSGGPSLRFMITVENVGKLSVSAGPSNNAVAVHGPTHVTKTDLPYVAAGGSVIVQIVYKPEASEPAGYPNVPFTITVNGNHSIPESNYDNNKMAITPSIPTVICNALNTSSPGH